MHELIQDAIKASEAMMNTSTRPYV